MKKAHKIMIIVSATLVLLAFVFAVFGMFDLLAQERELAQMPGYSGSESLGFAIAMGALITVLVAMILNEIELIRKLLDLRFEVFMSKLEKLLTIATIAIASFCIVAPFLYVAYNTIIIPLLILIFPLKLIGTFDVITFALFSYPLIIVCNTIRLFISKEAKVNFNGKTYKFTGELFKEEITEDNIVGEITSVNLDQNALSVDFESNCASIGSKIAVLETNANAIFLKVKDNWYKFETHVSVL